MPRTKRTLSEAEPGAQAGMSKRPLKSKATRTSASIVADSDGADAADGNTMNTPLEENGDSNVILS